MKYLRLCAVFATVSATTRLFAESPFESELAALKDQRDKALAAAAEPINRRYQAALEPLLRRATQANDLTAAVKIKAELGGSIPDPTPSNKFDASIQTVLKTLPGQWNWQGTKLKDWGTFSADARVFKMGPVKHEVKVTAGGTVTVIRPDNKKATIHLSPDMQSFTGTNFDGEPVTGTRRK